MKQLRLCKVCGRLLPAAEFYRCSHWVCKACQKAKSLNRYAVRTLESRVPFVCVDCGDQFPPGQASSYARNLCKSCYAKRLLARKAKAPEQLKCHVCGRVLDKSEFERYSTTRCRECATRAVRRYYRRNHNG